MLYSDTSPNKVSCILQNEKNDWTYFLEILVSEVRGWNFELRIREGLSIPRNDDDGINRTTFEAKLRATAIHRSRRF